ncbi:DUF4352 domain-containing protein [Rhodococcus sp. NPDC127530]|uniref:DUF4352 domain-containing protein n=1 Tax=unclassified Rhodococcus (in: high G+C Gram-positive bacteria) TaxID=192944 RepID=UPI00362A96BE
MTYPPQPPYDPRQAQPQQQFPQAQQPAHGQNPQQAYGQTPPPPYGPPPGYQPLATPPQGPKKTKMWPWIVGIIVAIIVISSLANGGEKEESSSASSTTQAITPIAEADAGSAAAPTVIPAVQEPTAGIGAEVHDGKFAFVVTGIETGLSSIGDNPYLAEDADGQFILVHVNVTNISGKPQSYFGSNQTLVDVLGREFTNNTMAAINVDAENAIGGDINPGITKSVTIVFDIPVDATPKAIEVHDSMFSGGATISLTQ